MVTNTDQTATLVRLDNFLSCHPCVSWVLELWHIPQVYMWACLLLSLAMHDAPNVPGQTRLAGIVQGPEPLCYSSIGQPLTSVNCQLIEESHGWELMWVACETIEDVLKNSCECMIWRYLKMNVRNWDVLKSAHGPWEFSGHAISYCMKEQFSFAANALCAKM